MSPFLFKFFSVLGDLALLASAYLVAGMGLVGASEGNSEGWRMLAFAVGPLVAAALCFRNLFRRHDASNAFVVLLGCLGAPVLIVGILSSANLV